MNAYAQARIQSRYGQRLAEPVWLRLQTIEDGDVLLRQARETGLAPWIHNIRHNDDSHTTEQHLRTHFLSLVEETAGWMPKEWRPAILWIAKLPDLPLWQYLQNGGTIVPWMSRDPALAPWIRHFAAPGSFPVPEDWLPLLKVKPPVDLTEAWLTHWRHLWPQPEPLAEPMIRRILARLALLRTTTDLTQAREIRLGLRQDLVLEFRRHALQPTAAFAYLALIGLDMLRLRGLLATRPFRFKDVSL